MANLRYAMVSNEATTLDLCRLLLGDKEVAQARLSAVDGVEGVALMVDRFDRRGSEKLRCEDFAQAIAQPPGHDHKGKYQAGYEALGRALRHSASRLLDARRLFKRLSVYVALGNVDCHLKNWSLLETSEGLRLAPVYDALNGYVYANAGYTTRFGLQIGPERIQLDKYDRTLLLEIAGEIDLPRRAAEGVLTELKKKWGHLSGKLKSPLGLDEERTWAYRVSVSEAWERIYG